MNTRILSGLIAVGVVTVIFGSIYVVTQQSLRLSANDPQIQMAEDIAQKLSDGKLPTLPSIDESVNLRTSLAPFFIIFDSSGKPISSSAILDDATPQPPKGVFDYTEKMGEDRLTWQPAAGVRLATVVKKYNSGFVVAGRSLHEVEKRIDQITVLVGLGWLANIFLIGLYGLLNRKRI